MKQMIKKSILSIMHSKRLSWLRKIIYRAIEADLREEKGLIIYYRDPERINAFDMAWRIKKSGPNMLYGLELNEAIQLFSVVLKTQKVKGDIAEVGVYTGGSARLICEGKGERKLHLFDTFEGLPAVSSIDRDFIRGIPYRKGQFEAEFARVKESLKDFKNVYFYRGIFPKTGEHVKDNIFSMVHLDVDTYESTIDCLNFFYPRMSKGGIIISHDYNLASGVKAAFNEFIKNKSEPIIELSGTQCLIVKI